MKLNKRSIDNFHNPNKFESGFTLIEVIVSMLIFLIVTASIYGLLSLGRVSRDRASQKTDVLKNARAALHLIGRDALNAGLGYHQAGALIPDDFISDTLGVPADGDDKRDILTSVIAGNDIFSNNLQAEKTDIIAFAYRDSTFNNGNALSLNGSLRGVDDNVARLNLRAGSNTSDVNPFDLMLVEADNTQLAVLATSIQDASNINFEAGDSLSINQPWEGEPSSRTLLRKCSPAIPDNCTNNLSSLKRFFWVSYKVKEDGTLVRITYGNNRGQPFDEQLQERPLAYNVKNLQFTYVLTDGTVTENPAEGADGVAGTDDDKPENSNLIRQITVSIEVQSTENDKQTNKPILIKLSGTFSTRNLAYDIG